MNTPAYGSPSRNLCGCGLLLPLLLAVLLGCVQPGFDPDAPEAVELREAKERAERERQEVMDILKGAKEGHRREIDSLTTAYREALEEAERLQEDLAGLEREHQQALEQAEREHQQALARLEGEHQQALESKEGELTEALGLLERMKREGVQALQEIEELTSKRAEAEGAWEQLQRFQVLRSRFHLEEHPSSLGLTSNQPIIELTVENGTEHVVSRAHFKGTLATPGRRIPWLEETFNFRIEGGLEPGERAKWRLTPDRYSRWGRVEAPPDAVFTVTVERLDGPNGEPLFADSIDGFSEGDEIRLDALEGLLDALEQSLLGIERERIERDRLRVLERRFLGTE